MESIDPSEGLVRLAHAIIYQAVVDYEGLRDDGAFTRGEVNWSRWFRRQQSGGLSCPKNYVSAHHAVELLRFFEGWPLDFLCDLTGNKACRIRKKLGITKKEVL